MKTASTYRGFQIEDYGTAYGRAIGNISCRHSLWDVPVLVDRSPTGDTFSVRRIVRPAWRLADLGYPQSGGHIEEYRFNSMDTMHAAIDAILDAAGVDSYPRAT